MTLRFGLNGATPLSLQATATKMDIGVRRVRRAEEEALEILRDDADVLAAREAPRDRPSLGPVGREVLGKRHARRDSHSSLRGCANDSVVECKKNRSSGSRRSRRCP